MSGSIDPLQRGHGLVEIPHDPRLFYINIYKNKNLILSHFGSNLNIWVLLCKDRDHCIRGPRLLTGAEVWVHFLTVCQRELTYEGRSAKCFVLTREGRRLEPLDDNGSDNSSIRAETERTT